MSELTSHPIKVLEQHPYAVAGVVFVVGAFVLYHYIGGGGGGGGSVTVAAPAQDNSSLAASVQLAGQQNALAAQSNTLATQLQALQISTDATTAQKTLDVQGSIDLAKIQQDTQTQIASDQLTATLAEYQAQSSIQALGITTQKDIADTAAATQLAALNTQAAEQVAISNSAAATQLGIAGLSASIQSKQIDAQSQIANSYINLQSESIQSADYQAGLKANIATEAINSDYGKAQLSHDYAVQSLPYQQDALARVINYNETLAGWNEQIAQYGIVYGAQTAQVLGADSLAQASANANAAVQVASVSGGNSTGATLAGAGNLVGSLAKVIGAIF